MSQHFITLYHHMTVGSKTPAVDSIGYRLTRTILHGDTGAESCGTRLLHRMAGRRIGRTKIGQTYEPSGVSPELADSTVDLINLSGGEQEQLYLTTHLALAEALAKEESQMGSFLMMCTESLKNLLTADRLQKADIKKLFKEGDEE